MTTSRFELVPVGAPGDPLDTPAVALVAALESEDATAIRRVMRGTVPESFENMALDAHPVLVSTRSEMAAVDPAAYAVCALARVHDPVGLHAESAEQLLEAATRLVEAGRADWASFTTAWWLRVVAYLSDWGNARRRAVDLIERGGFETSAPEVLACAAACASLAGDDVLADRWWESAFRPAKPISADVAFCVHLERARCYLIPRGIGVRGALQDLRTARNHFMGSRSRRRFMLFHAASMNLVLGSVLLGRHAEALQLAREDLRRCPPMGEYAAYLHAFRALAAVWYEEYEEADQALQLASMQREVFSGLELLAVGPARMLLNAHRGDVPAIHAEIGRLLRVEASSDVPRPYRAFWRWAAATACMRVSLRAKAHWLVDESLEIATQPTPLPLYELLAHLLAFQLSDDPDHHARRAVEIGVESSYEELLASPDNVPLVWHSALNPQADWPAHRTVLQLADPEALRVGLDAAIGGRAVNESELERMCGELGIAPEGPAHVDERLQLRLLGQFELVAAGRAVARHEWYGRRRARLLMARLALAEGAAVHRDALAEDLWSEEPGGQSAKRLAPLVWTIRNIARQTVARDAEELLAVSSGSYQLRLAESDSCDVVEFARSAEACLDAQIAEQVERHGCRAMALYRGEFMAGEGYEDWLVSTRIRFGTRYAEVIRHVLEVTGRVPDSLTAKRHLEDTLKTDPTNEVVAGALLAVYECSGDIGQATRTFHETRAALTEIGLAPSAELTALHHSLLGA